MLEVYSSDPIVFCYMYLLLLSLCQCQCSQHVYAGWYQAVFQHFSFSCFFSFLSHIMASTLLHAAAPASTLLCLSLLLPPSSHTVPPKYTKLFTCLMVFPSTTTCEQEVHLLFANPHCFGLLQNHSEATVSKGVIPFLQSS